MLAAMVAPNSVPSIRATALVAFALAVACTEPGAPRVATVTVSGAHPIGSIGSTVQLTAVAKDGKGNVLTDRAVTWSSSNAGVASIDANTGLATATGVGSATLSATIDGVVGSQIVTVTQVPASLTLTAPTDTLRALGATGQFTVVVKDTGGTTIPSPSMTWTSSNSAIVTVSSSQGLATAVANGDVYVRGQAGEIIDSLALTVRQRADLAKSVLSLNRPQLFVGDAIRATLQLRDANDNALAFGGAGVSFSQLGSAGSGTVTVSPTVDGGNGSYTADLVGAAMGTAFTVTATVDGVPVPSTRTARVVGFTRIAVAGATLIGAETTTGGYSCGIITTGDMYCWGIGSFGVLGDGGARGPEPNPTPTLVSGGLQWTDVSTGTWSACAIAAGGAAYCWGDGDVGQIGNGASGNPPDVRAPTPVLGGHSFSSISVGMARGACAITLAKASMCWGEGTWGRLGNGSEDLSAVPVTTGGGLAFDVVATSYSGSCGIASATAYCWGHIGVLGLGGAPAPGSCAGPVGCSKTPVAVSGGHAWRPIIARDGNVACAVATDNNSYCWGSGYLGNGAEGLSDVPLIVSGGLTFGSLAANDAAYCGITTGGDAYCWGNGRNGRLGNNSTANAFVPVAVVGGHKFTQLSLSQDHACGVRVDGNAYCWGGNDKGELGTRNTTPSLVPVRVKLFAP
jgi:hypothetical protein